MVWGDNILGTKKPQELFDDLIEKIINKEPVTSSNDVEINQDDKELLTLAKLLREVDFSKDSKLNSKTLCKKTKDDQELDDDDLDLVAGGRNPNALVKDTD